MELNCKNNVIQVFIHDEKTSKPHINNDITIYLSETQNIKSLLKQLFETIGFKPKKKFFLREFFIWVQDKHFYNLLFIFKIKVIQVLQSFLLLLLKPDYLFSISKNIDNTLVIDQNQMQITLAIIVPYSTRTLYIDKETLTPEFANIFDPNHYNTYLTDPTLYFDSQLQPSFKLSLCTSSKNYTDIYNILAKLCLSPLFEHQGIRSETTENDIDISKMTFVKHMKPGHQFVKFLTNVSNITNSAAIDCTNKTNIFRYLTYFHVKRQVNMAKRQMELRIGSEEGDYTDSTKKTHNNILNNFDNRMTNYIFNPLINISCGTNSHQTELSNSNQEEKLADDLDLYHQCLQLVRDTDDFIGNCQSYVLQCMHYQSPTSRLENSVKNARKRKIESTSDLPKRSDNLYEKSNNPQNGIVLRDIEMNSIDEEIVVSRKLRHRNIMGQVKSQIPSHTLNKNGDDIKNKQNPCGTEENLLDRPFTCNPQNKYSIEYRRLIFDCIRSNCKSFQIYMESLINRQKYNRSKNPNDTKSDATIEKTPEKGANIIQNYGTTAKNENIGKSESYILGLLNADASFYKFLHSNIRLGIEYQNALTVAINVMAVSMELFNEIYAHYQWYQNQIDSICPPPYTDNSDFESKAGQISENLTQFQAICQKYVENFDINSRCRDERKIGLYTQVLQGGSNTLLQDRNTEIKNLFDFLKSLNDQETDCNQINRSLKTIFLDVLLQIISKIRNIYKIQCSLCWKIVEKPFFQDIDKVYQAFQSHKTDFKLSPNEKRENNIDEVLQIFFSQSSNIVEMQNTLHTFYQTLVSEYLVSPTKKFIFHEFIYGNEVSFSPYNKSDDLLRMKSPFSRTFHEFSPYPSIDMAYSMIQLASIYLKKSNHFQQENNHTNSNELSNKNNVIPSYDMAIAYVCCIPSESKSQALDFSELNWQIQKMEAGKWFDAFKSTLTQSLTNNPKIDNFRKSLPDSEELNYKKRFIQALCDLKHMGFARPMSFTLVKDEFKSVKLLSKSYEKNSRKTISSKKNSQDKDKSSQLEKRYWWEVYVHY